MLDRKKKILELAVGINEKVKSLHQVISDFDLPSFYPSDEEIYIKKFGKDKISEYKTTMSQLNETRDQVTEAMNKKFGKPTRSTSNAYRFCIAACHLGFGACQEMNKFMILELVKKSIPHVYDINLYSSKMHLNHNLAICSDSSLDKYFQELKKTDFSSLPSDALIIDTLLGTVISAEEFKNSDIHKYLEQRQLDTAEVFTELKPENFVQTQQILKDAETIAKTIKLEEEKAVVAKQKNAIENALKWTGKNWKYYPAVPEKKGYEKAQVLFQSKDEKEIEELQWRLSKQNSLLAEQDQIQIKRKAISTVPKTFVISIIEPKLESLESVNSKENRPTTNPR